MPEIPLAPLDRIFRKAGAKRVSESATRALRDLIEKVCYEIAKEAIILAAHAGRKTVIREDVLLAARHVVKYSNAIWEG
ncbi:MAG: histone [Thermoprotei archaeon]|nr:MAG: histone [Thermoprotei archaeon]RLF19829.1 MAG: histone [Thermoprotei archaeon]